MILINFFYVKHILVQVQMSPWVACGHVSWRQLFTSRFFHWQQNSLVYPNAGLFAIVRELVSCKNVPLAQNIPRFMYHLPCSFWGNGFICHYSVFLFFPVSLPSLPVLPWLLIGQSHFPTSYFSIQCSWQMESLMLNLMVQTIVFLSLNS